MQQKLTEKTTLENRLAESVKHIPCSPTLPLLVMHPTEMHQKTRARRMFFVTLFIIPQTKNNTNAHQE